MAAMVLQGSSGSHNLFSSLSNISRQRLSDLAKAIAKAAGKKAMEAQMAVGVCNNSRSISSPNLHPMQPPIPELFGKQTAAVVKVGLCGDVLNRKPAVAFTSEPILPSRRHSPPPSLSLPGHFHCFTASKSFSSGPPPLSLPNLLIEAAKKVAAVTEGSPVSLVEMARSSTPSPSQYFTPGNSFGGGPTPPRKEPPPPTPAPVGEATPKEWSLLDAGLFAYSTGAMGAIVAIMLEGNVKDWGTAPKRAFILSAFIVLGSLVAGLATAGYHLIPVRRCGGFSAFCARFGTILSSVLVILGLACKFGRVECVDGICSAAVVAGIGTFLWVLEWLLSRRLWRRQGKPADAKGDNMV